jgi:hypothetical protein
LGPQGGGADLLQLFLPWPDAVPLARPIYLGLVACALVGVALVVTRRRVDTWIWLGGAVVLGLFALGPYWSVAGVRLPGLGPAGWLVEVVPILGGLAHWHRAAGPLSVLLVPLVARGVSAAAERIPLSEAVRDAILVVLVLADLWLLSPRAWPLPRPFLRSPPR